MTVSKKKPVSPWVIVGNTIDEMKWDRSVVALRLGMRQDDLTNFINSQDGPMNIKIAKRLERVIGATAETWMDFQYMHQSYKRAVGKQLF